MLTRGSAAENGANPQPLHSPREADTIMVGSTSVVAMAVTQSECPSRVPFMIRPDSAAICECRACSCWVAGRRGENAARTVDIWVSAIHNDTCEVQCKQCMSLVFSESAVVARKLAAVRQAN